MPMPTKPSVVLPGSAAGSGAAAAATRTVLRRRCALAAAARGAAPAGADIVAAICRAAAAAERGRVTAVRPHALDTITSLRSRPWQDAAKPCLEHLSSILVSAVSRL